MTDRPTYRIRDWDRHFETAQSRKVRGPLQWVAIPTQHDGRKYRRLMRLPNGPLVFAAWVLMLEVAAKCPTRGTLVANDGPLDADDLALMTDATVDLFRDALSVLTDPTAGICWIEVVGSDATAADNGSAVVAHYQHDATVRHDMPATEHTVQNNTVHTVQNTDSVDLVDSGSGRKKKTTSVFSWLNPEDLRDVGKLLDWQKRAAKCRNPVCDATEADRLNIVAAAVHCWDHADDPIKLFSYIVGKKQWHRLNERDEDTAHALIKEHLTGGSKPRRQNGDCKSAAESMPDLLAGLGVKP